MRIQHNIPAMSAYRNYINNTNAVSKNLEKLSSGYKINRAGDDAAGLAISEKMRAQITGLEAASKNAKDGISLVKTAEGALQEVHDMLNRMDYLATQSANGTYDNETDRYQLQKEVDQLKSEINRIADSANFNGIKLLDGSLSTAGNVAAYQNVNITAIADATPERTPANGKYQLDLSQSEWKVNTQNTAGQAVANDDGNLTMNFGGTNGITVEITNLDPNDKVTGKDITSAIYNAIQNNGTYSGTVAGGNIAVSMGDGSAGQIGFDADGNFMINGKKVSVANDNGVLTFTGVDSSELKSKNLDTSVKFSTTAAAGTISNPNLENAGGNQGWDQGWKVLEEAVDNSNTAIGHAAFDLADLKIKDGTTVKIGDQTYTFALGKNSEFKNAANVVDLTDMETMPAANSEDWVKVVGRLTAAAANNSMVSVTSASTGVKSNLGSGAGDTKNLTNKTTSTVLLTEKFGSLDRDKYDVFGKIYDGTTATKDYTHDAKWKTADGISLVQVGDAKIGGTALTLQIGDTSDSFNQLKVSINDCHVAAMGLGSMDISTQAGAAAAVSQIKAAINYVSDVRGTLGATQNRLDHTINNLSVMRENIQDAESTIRDTDIAEEMMSYTKNNILVQSAQAMLAQANQIPQGVLQLLG